MSYWDVIVAGYNAYQAQQQAAAQQAAAQKAAQQAAAQQAAAATQSPSSTATATASASSPSQPAAPAASVPVVTAPVLTAPVVTAPVVTAPVVTAPVVTAPVVTAPVADLPPVADILAAVNTPTPSSDAAATTSTSTQPALLPSFGLPAAAALGLGSTTRGVSLYERVMASAAVPQGVGAVSTSATNQSAVPDTVSFTTTTAPAADTAAPTTRLDGRALHLVHAVDTKRKDQAVDLRTALTATSAYQGLNAEVARQLLEAL